MVTEFGRSAYFESGIPEEEYFERRRETEALAALFGRVSRGQSVGGLIEGLRGVGKTDLIGRAIRLHMTAEPETVTVYYSLQPYSLDLFDLTRSFYNTFVRQYLYSRRGEEADLQRCIDAWHSGAPQCTACGEPVLREICEAVGRAYSQRDSTNVLSLLVNMPHYLAELQGIRCQVIIDQARYLLQVVHEGNSVPLLRHLLPNLESPTAPLFLVDSTVALRTMLGDQLANERMSQFEVRRLETFESMAMLQTLSERLGVEMSVRLAETMVQQLGGLPLYLHSIVRRAHLSGQSLNSTERFGEVYAQEIRDGTVHWYWRAQFSAQFPNAVDRHRAVELCSYLSLLYPQRVNLARLSQRLDVEPSQLKGMIARLQLMGVLDRSFGTVGLTNDPVLRDLVTVLAWGESSSTSDAELLRRLAARRIRGASAKRSDEITAEFIGRLERLLESFRGQYLPAEWFRYHEDYSSSWTGAEGVRKWLGSSDTLVRLPFLTAISTADVGPITEMSTDHRPVVLSGTGYHDKNLTPGNETLWLVIVWPTADPIDAALVHESMRIRARAAERTGRKVRNTWLIGKATFTREARQLCSRLQLFTGNMDMVDYIFDQMFAKDSPWRNRKTAPTPKPEMIVTPPAKEGEEAGPEVHEISLPAANYPERIATETLEEIARSAGFSIARIGQIKMAVLEAVINAAESSQEPTDKINIRYEVHADRLEVFVRSRVTPQQAQPTGNGQAPLAGWGLRMIYTLADEVTIRPFDDGTEIQMTCRRETAG